MVDAHCHLYESKNISGEVIGFREIGGEIMLCCGSDLKSSQRSVELSRKYSEVYAAVGVHPEHGKLVDSSWFIEAAKDNKVIAIGECGLDYRPETTEKEKGSQVKLLRFNIDLAKKTNLPLVVHCRNAFQDLLTIDHWPLNIGVMMHCFTGNLEQMQECVRRGWYISFGGILTFKSSLALRDVARQTPEDKLLIETDSPYLAPEPLRGSINEPKNVKIVADTLARIKGASIQEINAITTKNFYQLFNITPSSPS